MLVYFGHIVVISHVRDHLDEYDILSPLQHGFRERHSCESQLLLTLQDLFSWRDRGVQIDPVLLDFAKAFDIVPHESVLGKLKFYRIDDDINRWVWAFLSNGTQDLVVDGGKSDRAAVASGYHRELLWACCCFYYILTTCHYM